MKNILKLLLGLTFCMGMYFTSNAQSKTDTLPAEDQIVCRQISENVFDCYVEGDFEDLEVPEEQEKYDPNKDKMKKDDGLYEEKDKARKKEEEEYVEPEMREINTE